MIGVWGSKPQRVTGPVNLSKARVVWSAGTLHVFSGPNTWTSYPAAEMPGKTQGKWTLETEGGTLRWWPQGCPSCGWWGKGPDSQWIAKAEA